jgi:hypothetical protein
MAMSWRTQARVMLALILRGLWAQEQAARDLLWRKRRGYLARPLPTDHVAVTGTRIGAPPPRKRPAGRVSVGLIAEGSSGLPFEQAAEFYGIPAVWASPSAADELIERGVAERWPLIGVPADSLGAGTSAWPAALRSYVAGGGTLILTGLVPSANGALDRLDVALETRLPRALAAGADPARVQFGSDSPELTAEFTGVELDSEPGPALEATPGWSVIAWRIDGSGRRPALMEARIGFGRVIACASASGIESLASAYTPRTALRVLPAMMAIRSQFGEFALHPPARFANFTIDDPALRGGRLGLDYARAAAAAAKHRFHLTIATIPSELGIADPAVVERLRQPESCISACFHGNSHSGYEFFLSDNGRARYRSRSIVSQRRSLRSATERGSAFARRTGLPLDRVMVFPNGIGHIGIFGPLQDAGFISTANFSDRYPLGADPPDAFDLGMRPADLAEKWGGYPLLWRRGLSDRTWLFDLFAGRPVLTFAHVWAVDPDLTAFATRAGEIRGAETEPVEWQSLETIARHSYVWQRTEAQTWSVRMYSNEICLHNPDPFPRTCVVERPQLSPGAFLHVPGRSSEDHGRAGVEIPARGSVTLQVRTPSWSELPHASSCALLRSPQETVASRGGRAAIVAGLARGTA